MKIRSSTPTSPVAGNKSGHRCASEILDERAQVLAREANRGQEEVMGRQMVIFRLGCEQYGLEVRLVNGIHDNMPITPVPQTPDHFIGVGNFRGEPLSLFDLGRILGIGPTDLSDSDSLLVFGEDTVEFGFPVDEVTSVCLIEDSSLHELPDSRGESGKTKKLLKGVTSDALGILDGDALLQHPLLSIGSTN